MKYLAIFWFVTLVACARKKLGDSCKLTKSASGVCLGLAECESAKKELVSNGKLPVPCNFFSRELFCCQEEDTISEQQTPRISFTKCSDYSLWMTSPVTPGERKQGVCGTGIEPLIINGVEAKAMEFPHMAHIGYADSYSEEPEYACGGSLISEYFVLTAAHCLVRDGINASHVKLGTGDKRSLRVYQVQQAISHPRYNSSEKYHDIALLRLKKKVIFTDFRRPACLHQSKTIPYQAAVASGWGVTDVKKGTLSDQLMKVKIPMVPQDVCAKEYASRFLVFQLPQGIDEASMFCGGGFDIRNDTCQGDSGGPLQTVLEDPKCMYNILGVTSFGLGECGTRAPGVYTRVSAYLDWIEQIVWP